MSLDETSLAVGRLQAAHEATQNDITELRERTESMDRKLDRLLARPNTVRLTVKHWLMILAGGSAGGGGVAHALKKLLE